MSGECDKCGNHSLECICKADAHSKLQAFKGTGLIGCMSHDSNGWISVKKRLPEIKGRYLINTTCSHFAHNELAWDWPNPCGEINIAYYNTHRKWYYGTQIDWDPKV